MEIYVLRLRQGKYYVGKSNNVSERYKQHCSGKGSEWTRLYCPLQLVERICEQSEHDENNITKNLMKKYGVDNVRGGSYCQIILSDAVKLVLETELNGIKDLCYSCGLESAAISL
jgi:predicted GIY-YIG superfamily endonuclease